MTARRSKYGNRKTVVDGITFASAAEAKRYAELKLLQRAGQIFELELQPKFPIEIEGVHCFTYRGDFAYFEKSKRVVEDVKGLDTPLSKLKRKCVEARYRVRIQLVRA